jgi:hypothetical protein|tara:strand:- start:196 stop:345 length:150 start_codon:yes stop_codon:yes gene_type:complete
LLVTAINHAAITSFTAAENAEVGNIIGVIVNGSGAVTIAGTCAEVAAQP